MIAVCTTVVALWLGVPPSTAPPASSAPGSDATAAGSSAGDHANADPTAATATATAPTRPNRRAEATRAALRRLRSALEGGQPHLPTTPYRVAAGKTAPEVALLRDRLALEGFHAGPAEGNLRMYFDKSVQRALWDWQSARGLPLTSWIDGLTRRELNAPLDGLLADLQLAVNRWEVHETAAEAPFTTDSGRRVIVHLNRGMLVAEEDGVEQLRMPVVIGRADPRNATPALSAPLRSVVMNPTWRVPRRIVDETLRPSVSNLPGLARDRGFEVTVEPDGRWRVVQPAGPDNPLGRAKFVLVGTDGIYLHDTPGRSGIKAATPVAERALSHGCIRVSDSEALARWVLGRAPQPDGADKQATRTLRPPHPVTVHLVYQTLTVETDGRLTRHPDVYRRDAEARAAAALEVALGPAAGRLAVVTFVADWCAACKTMAPQLVRFAEQTRGAGVDLAMIGLSVDGPTRATWPFRVHDVPAAVAGGDSAFGVVDIIPTTWLVSPGGTPLYRYEGAGPDVLAALSEDLRGYLAAEAALEGTGVTP